MITESSRIYLNVSDKEQSLYSTSSEVSELTMQYQLAISGLNCNDDN